MSSTIIGLAVSSSTGAVTLTSSDNTQNANTVLACISAGTTPIFTSLSSISGATLLFANINIPVGNTIASTGSETAFSSSYTFAANEFKAGRAYRLILSGVYSTDTLAPTLRAKIKLGSVVIADTGALTGLVGLTSNLGWRAELTFICNSVGVSGVFEAGGIVYFSTSATVALTTIPQGTSTYTVDTTVTEALTVTIIWGTSSASNTITLRQALLESLR